MRGAVCHDVVGAVGRNVRGGDAAPDLLVLLGAGEVVDHRDALREADVLHVVVQTDAVVGRQRTAQIEKT